MNPKELWSLSLPIGLMLAFVAGVAQAQQQVLRPVQPGLFSTPYSVEAGYVTDSTLKEGTREHGDMNTFQSIVRVSSQYQYTENYSMRFGVGLERYGFGLPSGTPLPNTLASTALLFGNNWRITEKWLAQLELEPGIYSDFKDISWGDVNVPTTVRVAYNQNPRVIWVAAIVVNFRSEFPVFGGVGVQWQIADEWTLRLIMPEPRIDYRPIENLTLSLGASFAGDSYRVGENFGASVGRPELNDEDLTYREARVGIGIRYQITKGLAVVGKAGIALDRRFNYSDANLLLRTQDAGYFALSLLGSF